MTGGISGFMAGLEGLPVIEQLSERFQQSPQFFARILAGMLCAVVFVLVMIVVAQGSCSEKETLEVESVQTTDQGTLTAAATNFDNASAVQETAAAAQPIATKVVVYVTGAVQTPGVYTLESSQRISDAVAFAGGFAPEAASAVVNLAQNLEDGMQIHIPFLSEVSENAPGTYSTSIQSPQSPQSNAGATDRASVLININTADASALQTLDGVGPATAQRIIDYRTVQGPFKTKEDLMNVSGIGEKKYAALEASITV